MAQGESNLPSPRDRHVAGKVFEVLRGVVVVHNRSIFIFGGYDGFNRVNDFYEYSIDNASWQEVAGGGAPPTPRHSHSAVVYEDSMYVFGGYDGHYRNDFYRYNFGTNTWSQTQLKPNGNGVWPKSRYRTSTTVYKDMMFLFGGHDGARQLNDFYCFNFSKDL